MAPMGTLLFFFLVDPELPEGLEEVVGLALEPVVGLLLPVVMGVPVTVESPKVIYR